MLSYWDKDLICIYANEAYIEWFGKSREEIIGFPLQNLIDLDGQSTLLIQKVLSGEKVIFERDYSPYGTKRYTLVTYYPDIQDGVVKGFISHINDITAQKEKENELLKFHDEINEKAIQIENILENITDSFVVIDNDWMIRYWNKSAETVTGKSRAAVIGNNVWDVFKVKKDKVFQMFNKALISQVPAHFEHYSELMSKWFEISAYPSVKGLTVYFKDITIRKTHEAEIIRVKNNLSALINATKDLMWSVDTDYRLISANQPFYNFVKRVSGNEAREGDNILGDTHSKVNIEWKQLYDRCLLGESFIVDSIIFDNREVRFDPIYDSLFQVIGVACHSLDTADRNQLEREKAETAQRFTAIVQNGSDLIFIIDENNMPTYISPSVYNHLGYTPEFLYGRPVIDFIHKKDFAKLVLIAEASGDREVQLPPIRIKHANGSWRWIEATIDNLLDNPAVQGLVLNAKDITDRKKRETERELMFKELTRSNNDLKQFSFITSHNLRAPLSNITGLLAVFDHEGLDAGNKEILEMVVKAAQQLKNTIDDITEIVVIKNTIDTPVSVVDVNKMFNRVNRNFLNMENDIAAQISLDFAVNEIRFNKTYFESIFINLISNAIKYREAGVTLKIRVSTYLNEEGKAVLLFSDNGIGIDLSRHKDRIFGMYQRFHTHIDGQGLGLFIVKTQIEALGGKIEVESELHKGTRFIVTFP